MSPAAGETAAAALLPAPTPRPTPKPHAAYGAHHATSVNQDADVVIFALTIDHTPSILGFDGSFMIPS